MGDGNNAEKWNIFLIFSRLVFQLFELLVALDLFVVILLRTRVADYPHRLPLKDHRRAVAGLVQPDLDKAGQEADLGDSSLALAGGDVSAHLRGDANQVFVGVLLIL